MAERSPLLKAIKVNYALLSWFLPQADQFFHQKFLVSRLALSKFSRRMLSKGLPDKKYPKCSVRQYE
ncbi:hypothetical protein GNE08_08515 [Trichormus variabilis ARAD]|uniref:hypothetical protein n=1 Tax=Nostocaceae TaxID=1162 RepID=UPI000AFA717C|nr:MULTISPECIES: hypothetical protein [Nostocaceae]MBC1214266.1 hypothetical protein [Trichormus variabilis ARAD]MBC1268875.1 hypothetical protein [Trichormus variabilis FSR]MBC1325096.1 hypothetical protein [Trichormus variabilis 9RC]QHD79541.1 hypothetical protein GSQ19_07040 [Trichormus variabilis 0441]